MEVNERLLDAILSFQGGATYTFDIIYAESIKYVYFLINKTSGNSAVTEDICQEVFIKVYQNVHTLQDPRAYTGWLKRITLNCVSSHYRSQQSKNENESLSEDYDEISEKLETEDSMLLPEDSAMNAYTQQVISDMMDELSPLQKQCILSFYYYQMSIKDIAESMELPENTVKSHLKRGKDALQKKVLNLEKTQKIRLHSFALPAIMFALLGKEAQACAAPSYLYGKVINAIQLSYMAAPGVGAAVGGQISGAAAEGQVSGAAAEGQISGAAAEGQVSGAAAEGQVSGAAAGGQVSGAVAEGQISGAAAGGQVSTTTAFGGKAVAAASTAAVGKTAGLGLGAKIAIGAACAALIGGGIGGGVYAINSHRVDTEIIRESEESQESEENEESLNYEDEEAAIIEQGEDDDANAQSESRSNPEDDETDQADGREDSEEDQDDRNATDESEKSDDIEESEVESKEAEAPPAEGWKAAYADVMERTYNDRAHDGFTPGGNYCLIYLDSDDVPELAVSDGLGGTAGHFDLYSFKNGQAQLIDSIGAYDTFHYVPKKGKLISPATAGTGLGGYTFLRLSGNSLAYVGGVYSVYQYEGVEYTDSEDNVITKEEYLQKVNEFLDGDGLTSVNNDLQNDGLTFVNTIYPEDITPEAIASFR